MSKIFVVGEEDFTIGFDLVGVEPLPVRELETLLSKNSEAGIVIISEEEYLKLSVKIKNDIDKLLKPVVIILSKDDIKGSNLRQKIIRTLGVDLLKD